MVLIPTITYRLQNSILTEQECSELITPIRRTLKNKLKFSTTAPNCMMHGKAFYNLADLWSIQLQRQSTYILSIFGEKNLLYRIAKIRLFQLQTHLGSIECPLLKWNYPTKRIWKFNYLAMIANILFSANNQINFKINHDLTNKIIGGQHQINSILPIETIIKYGTTLFKHNIIFLEQLTTQDHRSLLTWNQIVTNNTYYNQSNRLPPRTPIIFK